jgi:hypothetical protein
MPTDGAELAIRTAAAHSRWNWRVDCVDHTPRPIPLIIVWVFFFLVNRRVITLTAPATCACGDGSASFNCGVYAFGGRLEKGF